jgi:hypothetical protein
MGKSPVFDEQEAHRYFAAQCFNATWDFIDKPSRATEEDDEMLLTCMASLWHWLKRADVTPKNLSIGYWQLSRVFALLGKAEDARRYGQLSLAKSHGLEPFYEGYAYEALARSEMIAGTRMKTAEYLSSAKRLCNAVSDPESKKLLAADLDRLA